MKSAVNLNRLGVFTAVVEAGSFTAAAERLGLTKAMVSQHVRRLEAELGVTLLNRTTRQVMLTGPGQGFYADCTQILGQAETAITRAGHGKDAPSGTLRITAAQGYGVSMVIPALTEFLERYPQMQVDFLATVRVLDPIGDRLDLSIRMGWPSDSSFRAIRLGTFRHYLVGSPKYLSNHGTPRRLEDLRHHRFIEQTLDPPKSAWTFTSARGKARRVRLNAAIRASTGIAVRAFVLAGAGLAVQPEFGLAAEIAAGHIVPLLTEYALPEGGIYAIYPMANPPAKVRVFVDFLREYLARNPLRPRR